MARRHPPSTHAEPDNRRPTDAGIVPTSKGRRGGGLGQLRFLGDDVERGVGRLAVFEVAADAVRFCEHGEVWGMPRVAVYMGTPMCASWSGLSDRARLKIGAPRPLRTRLRIDGGESLTKKNLNGG